MAALTKGPRSLLPFSTISILGLTTDLTYSGVTGWILWKADAAIEFEVQDIIKNLIHVKGRRGSRIEQREMRKLNCEAGHSVSWPTWWGSSGSRTV